MLDLLPESHAAVDVWSVGSNRRELLDPRVVGSEVAHRVGCTDIAGEREGLAAAAAEIQLATDNSRTAPSSMRYRGRR
jgi:hypothetical protein